MTLREQQSKFVECVGKLISFAYASGYELTFGDTYPGLAKHKINGKHPEGLAIDLNLFRDGEYLEFTEDHAQLGAYWKSLDPECTWGGDFTNPDGNHYSYGER